MMSADRLTFAIFLDKFVNQIIGKYLIGAPRYIARLGISPIRRVLFAVPLQIDNFRGLCR